MLVEVIGGTGPVTVTAGGFPVVVDAGGSTTVEVTGGGGGSGGPGLSDADPQPPGAADPGTSGAASRADHVHAPPSAGQIGALTEAAGDARYDALGAAAAVTASTIGAVPTARKVNGHALTGDVTVTAADVGADASGSAAAAQAASQPLDSDLTAIAALSTTSYGRAFLALADAAAGRTALGLGTAATAATGDFQPIDSDLTAIAALTTTSFGRSFLALADASAALSLIGAAASSHTHDTIGSFQVPIFGAVAASPTSPMTNAGTWFASLTSSAPYLTNTSAAVNDGRTWDYIRGSGGTYTLTSYHWVLTSGGVVTWYLDGTSLGTVDTYAAANTGGQTAVVATGITLSEGWHSFGWKVTSKHASSSGYTVRIYPPVLTRTA